MPETRAMAGECMECVEGRAVALGLCADCLAGEPVEAVVRQIARLTRELEEARACCKWEEDKQRRALEYWDGEYGTTLAEEFPYGCDTIEHVAEALIVARRELDAAREALTIANTTAANLHDVIRRKDRELEEARERERVRDQAAQALCTIYFEIAAEAFGEDEVRRLRDERIAARATHPTTRSESDGE